MDTTKKPKPGHFHIPGEATRREYAVYVMVARRKQSGEMHLYVGKTGDNREGCNPVISRAGNHFSFNRIHSQMRNHLPAHPEEFDFDFFYTTFGKYVDPSESRDGIGVINEMERELIRLVQGKYRKFLLNPSETKTSVPKWQRDKRELLRTEERLLALSALLEIVETHIATHHTSAPVIFEGQIR